MITVWLTRVSVALIFYRLASNRQRRRGMIYFAIGIGVLSLASLLIISLREQPLKPWRDALQLSTLYRWITVGALAAVVEFVLAGLAILLVWDLQMKARDKGRVVTGFAIRLVVVVPIILRLLSLHSHATKSPAQPISFLFTMPELWTQLELHLCLVAATVPCLRLFLKSFSTGYFGMAISQLDPTGTVLATKGDSYNMSNMKSGGGSSAGDRYKIGNPTQQQVSKAGMTTSKVTHELREDRADSLSDRTDCIVIGCTCITSDISYDRQPSTSSNVFTPCYGLWQTRDHGRPSTCDILCYLTVLTPFYVTQTASNQQPE